MLTVVLWLSLFSTGLLSGPCFDLDLSAGSVSIKTVGAKTAEGWNLWSNGYLGEWLKFHKKGTYRFTTKARGEKAAGEWPLMELLVDGRVVKRWNVESEEFREYSTEVKVDKGVRQVLIAFRNDYYARGQDRNLHLASITIKPPEGIKDPLVTKEPDWRAEADRRIEKIRKGDLLIKVVDADGRPVPDAKVSVKQTRHNFKFGTCLNARFFAEGAGSEAAKKYHEILKANFNCAVFENAFKWPQMERQQDKPDYSRVDAALDWCAKNQIPVRGHCIFWANEKRVPGWARALDDKGLHKAIETRIARDLGRYRGRIKEYDVNNEMVHCDYFWKRLGRPIRAEMFTLAHKADPKARLFLNDFNILNGNSLVKYGEQIESLVKSGAAVGGIGCQGHFGEKIPSPVTMRMFLDRLARFKLPILITEFDINTKDEKAKAKQLENFYRLCFSHPAVEGILMWGFWVGSHWRPDAAMFNRDFSPRPAAKSYRKLLFTEWWSQHEGKTDDKGRFGMRVFFGNYTVTVSTQDLKSGRELFDFSRQGKDKTVTIKLK